MFSMSGGTSPYDLGPEALKTMEVDIFRAVNNLYPKDVHPID